MGPVQRAIVPVSTGEDRRSLRSLGAVVLEGWRGQGLLLFGDAGGVEGGDVAEGAGGALD